MSGPKRWPTTTKDDEPGTAFVALYYGRTISTARLVATTVDDETVAVVVRRLMAENGVKTADLVTAALAGGRLQALRQILKQIEEER